MVMYFTGTGNSAYVAERIAAALGDTCINLFEKLRSSDYSEIYAEKAYVVVCPTYAWQIPHILRDWLKKVKLAGSRDIYFVMTCGGDISNAEGPLKKLCKKKGMNLKGCAEIVMPENYIALFNAPKEKEAREVIRRANPVIDSAAEMIAGGDIIPGKAIGVGERLKSSIVNDLFYPAIVHAKKFSVSEACIGCGKCAKGCVMNNIRMVDNKPVWKDQCTHCMACICGCPKEAIEYGTASKGKPRYQCPEGKR